ncbi:hypothetical protein AALP_AA4G121200 [Arabis alpina]|uniref:Uncharacterized protein n=1 Tax=Arabis alpina TaxID=50452 RepID=A0A087H2R4_ARAAL|nr:hypothetical protein AALP_AA4G121200 [Arabis alpina]
MRPSTTRTPNNNRAKTTKTQLSQRPKMRPTPKRSKKNTTKN